MRIRLALWEVDYLLTVPDLAARLRLTPTTVVQGKNHLIVEVTDSEAEDFREACLQRFDREGLGADYEPTPAGRILNSLIDRFVGQ